DWSSDVCSSDLWSIVLHVLREAERFPVADAKPGHRLMDAGLPFTHRQGEQRLRRDLVAVSSVVHQLQVRRSERAPLVLRLDAARAERPHLALAEHPPGMKAFVSERHRA